MAKTNKGWHNREKQYPFVNKWSARNEKIAKLIED